MTKATKNVQGSAAPAGKDLTAPYAVDSAVRACWAILKNLTPSQRAAAIIGLTAKASE